MIEHKIRPALKSCRKHGISPSLGCMECYRYHNKLRRKAKKPKTGDR